MAEVAVKLVEANWSPLLLLAIVVLLGIAMFRLRLFKIRIKDHEVHAEFGRSEPWSPALPPGSASVPDSQLASSQAGAGQESSRTSGQ
ncbi:hypothetical protein ILT44_06975 [Microvirga sp. BT689]|uniref:hypothetical protein n=1 Tax=Microvirga arvi TaxID=2778731 RepID=UPI001950CD05|nr:hypothetical protein [Microvirga arvi]MBM6579918.1 hypothetical protein [Microvirga arvi]